MLVQNGAMREFVPLRIAVLTVSDTRTAADDRSGDALVECVVNAGHTLAARGLVRDDVAVIEASLRGWIADAGVDVIVSTGGTGITGRDVTPEAFARVMEKEIAGFGELFRRLSYDRVGTSAMLSRAVGGVADGKFLFALPGSTGAVRDAWNGILQYQLDSRHAPCNLVDLMPRLRER